MTLCANRRRFEMNYSEIALVVIFTAHCCVDKELVITRAFSKRNAT